MDRVDVPCGACRLCCRSFMVPIQPEKGDDVSSYQTATCFTPGKPPYLILDRNANGDCVYLGDGGCTIWGRAPWSCRHFDCREMFKNSDRAGRTQAIKKDRTLKALFERGRELLKCG